jgi:CMD domain protein
MSSAPDIIDELAGVAPGGRVDTLRRARPETRAQSQASYDALFAPVDEAEASLAERRLVAAFVTRLAADEATARHYSALAHQADPALATAIAGEAAAASTSGPYGDYAEAGLQAENANGARYRASGAVRDQLGERLTAAIEHAHLLVYRPREASGDAIRALVDAGWSTDGIVTLSQLIAFLSFQQRVISGLRVLSEEIAA